MIAVLYTIVILHLNTSTRQLRKRMTADCARPPDEISTSGPVVPVYGAARGRREIHGFGGGLPTR